MSFILATKVGMSQEFKTDGTVIPVTLLEAGPCTVIHVKTPEKDGYSAIQVGFGMKQTKRINKAQIGHFKDLANFRYVREFRVDDTTSFKRGDQITAEVFKEGDVIDVQGVSKGRGFAGVIKRHHFTRGPETHGSRHHRKPGSRGSRFPQHTPRGRRLAGHLGDQTTTTKNLEVVYVDASNNILAIKGSVPGARHGLVLVEGVAHAK